MPYYVRATIVPWYREEHYAQVCKIMTDRARFPKSYNEWLDRARHKVEALKIQGHSVERVYLDPIAFRNWCERKRRKCNSISRQEFAAAILAGKHGDPR
jgi:hypothetical protein